MASGMKISSLPNSYSDSSDIITISSNGFKQEIEITRNKDNPRYYAKRAGAELYDLINECEEYLDEDRLEEVELLIMSINDL